MARDSMDGAVYTRKTSLDSTGTGSPRSVDNVWRSTFNPGRNMGVKGRDLYDHAPDGAPSVWAHVAKAEHLKQLSFANLDKNKGVCTNVCFFVCSRTSDASLQMDLSTPTSCGLRSAPRLTCSS